MTCGGAGENLAGFMDADGNGHAALGYAFIVNGAVSCSAKCQEVVILSSTESKCVGATHAAKEATWLHSLILKVF